MLRKALIGLGKTSESHWWNLSLGLRSALWKGGRTAKCVSADWRAGTGIKALQTFWFRQTTIRIWHNQAAMFSTLGRKRGKCSFHSDVVFKNSGGEKINFKYIYIYIYIYIFQKLKSWIFWTRRILRLTGFLGLEKFTWECLCSEWKTIRVGLILFDCRELDRKTETSFDNCL